MSARKKLWLKLIKKPIPNDISYNDIYSLLIYLGFEQRYAKGDHVLFFNDTYKIPISIDSNGKKTLKPAYIKNIVLAIEAVLEGGEYEL